MPRQRQDQQPGEQPIIATPHLERFYSTGPSGEMLDLRTVALTVPHADLPQFLTERGLWPGHPEEIPEEGLKTLCLEAVWSVVSNRPRHSIEFDINHAEEGGYVAAESWETGPPPPVDDLTDTEEAGLAERARLFNPYETDINFEVRGVMVNPEDPELTVTYLALQRWLGPDLPEELT